MSTVAVETLVYGVFAHEHRTIELRGAIGSETLWLVRTDPKPDLNLGCITHTSIRPSLTLNPSYVERLSAHVDELQALAMEVYRTWARGKADPIRKDLQS
ncbi:hypothetical protein AB0I28_33425 [Phytomonospora sp. NPDC050363]|uniref:hypothetical protein n=1 Tax=Phytomonospora sp. NPDC050363 TaxID=3155642 RepID=UPI0033EC872E